MSPLGRALADWIRSYPGHFTAPTYDECIKAAFDASKLTKHVSQDDFAAGLDRAGYAPQERRTGWILCLPERGIGSR